MSKRLSQLEKELTDAQRMGNSSNPEIQGISHDTRTVRKGELFICIPGFKQDGHEFAGKAIQSGATALVVQKPLQQFLSVPQLMVSDSRKAEAVLSAAFFDYPSRKIKLIGITGTNGKTTTTYFIESILKTAGYKPGVIGTVTYRYADKTIEAHNTTPSSLELNQIIFEMVKSGCDHLVMEVSSHALALGRVDGIDFDYAVFTHITRDHLDFHGTMEKYLEAKCLLFSKVGQDYDKGFSKKSIINIDDPHSSTVIQSSSAPVITYGLNDKAAVHAEHIDVKPNGLQFQAVTPNDKADIKLKLAGSFNVYNSLASVATCLSLNIPLDVIKQGLENLSYVPGRFQLVNRGQPFAVIVDYAHTDDALLNLLKSARQITKGKLIVVFGAGGDRDRGKRPMMGEVAVKLADKLIITSDNPRTEDPATIALDIEIGVKRIPQAEKRYVVILDREEAIQKALYSAKPSDTVVIAGKGHENYQVFADQTIHFDDSEIAAKYLEEITGNIKVGAHTN